MQGKWKDISMPLINDGATWPGDTPFSFGLSQTIEETKTVNVGEIHTGLHAGTHMDAPYHYNKEGQTIDQLPLDIALGKCLVCEVKSSVIDASVIEGVDLSNVERILFKSMKRDPAVFPLEYPPVDPELVPILKEKGIKLIGVDAPSVDPVDSKQMLAHLAFDRSNIIIIENLFLNDTSPGLYELLAMPLLIIGGDASPIRAILRSIS